MDYKVIDADGHILEPRNLWEEYGEAKYRDRLPRIEMRNGKEVFRVDQDNVVDTGFGLGFIGAMGSRDEGGTFTNTGAYETGREGGWNPHARIVDMDREGIDAAFLYPTLGLFMSPVKDPDLAAAGARAYNRWLADYCGEYPERLFGIAMIPLQSVEHAIAEMEFAQQQLGFRAGFIRPNPQNDRYLHDPYYYPLWEAAEANGFAFGIHEGAAGGQPTLGVERFDSFAVRHLVSHTFEMMAAAASVIMCGVCEKYPNLRFGFMEASGGWMAGWLDRMDRHYTDKGMNDTVITDLPSNIFRRQCFIAFEPVEKSLVAVAEYIGQQNILWATDYPHPDGFWNAARQIQQMGLPEPVLADIMATGAKRLYGLS
ncbi:MAG: amidohydrolase [Immundisolibacteraceae bacterium]|nr:amidohydrolase [Immundisolibacteraceae bacterium]